MQAVIDVALPVFAIMLCGVVAGRTRLMGTEAAAALNSFVYWFALPPVLFLGLARESLAQVLNGPFIGAFLGSLFATALLGALWVRFSQHRPPAASVLQQALNACFSNTGYMGIPLFLAAFGPLGLAPAILATVLVSSLVIGIAIVGIELTLARGKGVGGAAVQVLNSLVRNPLVMAPLLGAAVSALGIPLPRPLTTLGDLLGAAAGPCALFAIGLFLAGQRLRGAFTPAVAAPVALKLLVQPALAWVLVTHVFPVDPFRAGACIILAGLPTGALTFVVAQRYGLEVARTGAVILATTVASVFTLSALLGLLLPLPPPG